MTTLNKNQVLTMLHLQDKMNSAVNPDWRNAGYKWTRAILVETVEAIDHAGWPWWKKQAVNSPQLRLELVDVWHFMISTLIERTEVGNETQMEAVADVIVTRINDSRSYQDAVNFNNKSYDLADIDLLDALELMAGMAACSTISIRVFDACIEKSGLSWTDLFATYIGKNILNILRQSNGYKAGTYFKDWSRVELTNKIDFSEKLEDNDHLHDIISGLDANAEDFPEQLQSKLEARYEMVKAKQPTTIAMPKDTMLN